jgi:MFS transporter, ACS family, hexuronate transporter
MLSLGQVAMAIPMLLMSVTASFLQAVVIMFLAGMGRGTVLPGSTKAIMDWFPPGGRATAMGLKQTGVPAAGIFTALALPALGLALGWRYALAMVGIWIFVGAIVSALLYRDVQGPAKPSTQGAGLMSGIGELVRNPNIWIIGLVSTLFVTAQLSTITYLPLYLKEVVLLPEVPDEAARIVAAGTFLAVMQGGGVFGRVFWGVVSDRLFGGRRMVVLALVGAISAASAAAFAFADAGYPLWGLTALAFVLGVSSIGWNGIYHALMAETSGRVRAATGVGLMMTVSQIGPVAGPPLFGFIVDVSGTYRAAWLFMAVLGAMAAVVGFLTAGRERHVE